MRHSISFSQLVEEELLSYPHDALSLPSALKAAGAIFVNVLMRQHNLVALQGQFLIEPVEAYHALGTAHVGAIMAFAERQRDPRLPELLVMLVQGVVGNSALSFLDTPQIPQLVERVAAEPPRM
jgi:TctA family transporter